MNRYIWLYGALSCSIFICAERIPLLIIDTNGKDAYYYRNLIMLANSVGFKTDYKNIYDVLEEDILIHKYPAVFFFISPAMMQLSFCQQVITKISTIFANPTAHIAPHCFHILRSCAHQKNKAIGIILPGNVKYSESLKKNACELIYKIGQFGQLEPIAQKMLNDFIAWCTHSDSTIGSLFGTSLLNQSLKMPISCPMLLSEYALPLPIDYAKYPTDIQKAFPTGLLIQHPSNHMYLISKSSVFDFADVQENFFKNPCCLGHRNQLLKAAQETLYAWHYAIQHQQLPQKQPNLSLPTQLTSSYLLHAKKNITAVQQASINHTLYNWMFNKSIAAGWFDPYDFFAHEDQLKKLEIHQRNGEQYALEKGISIIYDGNFQLIWFECIPEWYLNPHGLRAAQKEIYINRIKQIGNQLQRHFQQQHTPLPKIFIGFNLTSNFKTNIVVHPVQSLSGTVYTKIPSPFDICHFWQPELLDVFDQFVALFKDHLPIDGVFFDFEMYHAQDQTGSYTDHMDFSDTAWHIYCHYTHNTHAYTIKSIHDRLAYLQQNKLFKNYFCVLENASRAIGKAIKRHMRKKLPHLLFAAYTPTLPSCWFYRGIMAGLSSCNEPLILATFNTDYVSHYAWLLQHNIYVLHGTAMMLSKLQKPTDFTSIKMLLQHHDFIWYNRPSRMIYQYDQEDLNKVWWGIEASPLNSKKLMAQIRQQHCW